MYHHYYQPYYNNNNNNNNDDNNSPHPDYINRSSSTTAFNLHHDHHHLQPHQQLFYSPSEYVPILPLHPMSPDQQVALTRASRQPSVGPSAQLSKATRQVVPAFLQKLYEMVNDPSNADLIRWSDAGDSFFVLDHERFAREVLGRWFKHQNFSSFVRQLNMYGFHKIPHLQQGVLRSESDTEFWNFEHPNFHRGQPDLLCLIQRKKQATQNINDQDVVAAANAAAAAIGPASATGDNQSQSTSPSGTSPPAGQVIDIHAIVNGIAAIKRHQTTISEELNELKRSNQLLWQDAVTARQRHQKHQDTINRILKFLAGVFGSGANGNGAAGGAVVGKEGVRGNTNRADAARAVYPRKNQRLMIEEAPKKEGKGRQPVVQVEEEDDDDSPTFVREISPVSLVSIPSPYNDPMSPTISEAPSYINLAAQANSPASLPSISRDNSVASSQQYSQILQPKPLPAPSNNNVLATMAPPSQAAPPAPSPHPLATSVEQEAMMQAFQQMLSSPGQMQRLLAALATHNLGEGLQGTPFGPGAPPGGNNAPLQQLSPYGAYAQGTPGAPGPHHYTPQGQLSLLTPTPPPLPPPPPPPTSNSNANTTNSQSPTPAHANGDNNIVPFDPSQQALADNAQRLDRTWKVTQDIDKDVNALHNSISSLIETFGLDPSLMDLSGSSNGSSGSGGVGTPNETATNGNGNGYVNSMAGVGSLASPPPSDGMDLSNPIDMNVPDFDFDAFLNEYGNGSNGVNGLGGGNSAMAVSPTAAGGGTGPSTTDDYDMQSTAFLDDVPSPSNASVISGGGLESPIMALRHEFASTDGNNGSLSSPRAKSRKRKSDAAEIEDIQKKNNAGVGSLNGLSSLNGNASNAAAGGAIKSRRKR